MSHLFLHCDKSLFRVRVWVPSRIFCRRATHSYPIKNHYSEGSPTTFATMEKENSSSQPQSGYHNPSIHQEHPSLWLVNAPFIQPPFSNWLFNYLMKEIQGSSQKKGRRAKNTNNWQRLAAGKKWKLRCLLIEQKIPENPQVASLVVGVVFFLSHLPSFGSPTCRCSVASRGSSAWASGILQAICKYSPWPLPNNSLEVKPLISQKYRGFLFKKV